MGYIIAMAGKGGTGKTTLAALIARIIKEKKLGSVLAVDADPNNNLAEALGIESKETAGQIIDEVAAHPEKIPSGMPKDRFIEYQLQTAISEGDGIDLLTMGRPEGPGCYCYVNNVLRNIVGKLIKEYDYIIIDNEAGLEHLSRRTTRRADALVVVSDATPVGLKAAARITDLVSELDIEARKKFLIINRSAEGFTEEGARAIRLDYLGNLAYDAQLERVSLNGYSLSGLKDDAPVLSTLRRIGERIWQRN
ncbi:MAG: AAA family ATPase [Candidatus Omnitrophota bacterium]